MKFEREAEDTRREHEDQSKLEKPIEVTFEVDEREERKRTWPDLRVKDPNLIASTAANSKMNSSRETIVVGYCGFERELSKSVVCVSVWALACYCGL